VYWQTTTSRHARLASSRKGRFVCVVALLLAMILAAEVSARPTRGAPDDTAESWLAVRGGFAWIDDIAFMSATDAWAVGSHVVHFDGQTWVASPDRPESRTLTGISLDEQGEGWAVGHGGLVMRRQSGTWSEFTLGVRFELKGLDLTSSGDGWAVGRDRYTTLGAMFRLRGGAWSQEVVEDIPALNDVSLIAQDVGWAVGNEGVILSWDGARWRKEELAPDANWHAVSASAPSDVWVAGGKEGGLFVTARQVLAHYDGASWKIVHDRVAAPFYDVYICRANCEHERAVAVAGWTVWTLSESDGWSVVGKVAMRFPESALHAIAQVPDQNRYVITGEDGTVAYLEDGRLDAVQGHQQLSGVAADGVGQLWCVGQPGDPLRFDGRAWRRDRVIGERSRLVDIDGTDAGNMLAVGFFGQVAHFENGTWLLEPAFTDKDLRRVRVAESGDAWVVGSTLTFGPDDGSIIAARHKGRWEIQYETAGSTGALRAIDVLENGHVWAVGLGRIVHNDGGGWETENVPWQLYSVDMLSDVDGWAGGDGVIIHFDGVTWKEVVGSEVLTNTSIASIAMIDAYHGWAAGRQGVVLRYDDGVWTYSRRPADLRRGSGVYPDDIGKDHRGPTWRAEGRVGGRGARHSSSIT